MNKSSRKLFSFIKIFFIWLLAFIITIAAAVYQRATGPTYPKKLTAEVNGKPYQLKLVRSMDLSERPEVKLGIDDMSISAKLWYKRLNTDDEYKETPFSYRVNPVNSYVMNNIFHITEEKGFFADVPPQPAAGKIQYYIEITDSAGTTFLMKERPVVIRFKGSVPSSILIPHILFMFLAMLFSTGAGILSIIKHPSYKKYALYTLILLTIGGMILGPVVQKYAFGDLWTGIPFGWDLTDNKTLIALLFWILAVYMSRKSNKPLYTALAALVLLIIFSIPHSMFGSELDYASGQVTQGIILFFFTKKDNNL